ncbi:hypothetical protein BXZ70DRAFT_870229, partial [Cristinia sonorae]
WRRAPSVTSVLLNLDLPYRPPKSAFGKWVWRKRVWLETTFALSVLEPWEKLLVLCVTYFTLVLVFIGLFTYAPQRISLGYSRMVYYFHGHQ